MSSTDDALSLAEQAEAEAAEAEAQATAARERAAELRSRLDDQQHTSEAASDQPDGDTGVEIGEAGAGADIAEDAPGASAGIGSAAARGRIPWLTLTVSAVATLLLCALLAASAYMLWQGRQTSERQARAAEFSAAARQGVINLMSLDFNNGDADIKRLIASTTGQFRTDFENSKNDFLTIMKDSKVVTKADVKATAVESMTDTSAVVLVAASSEVSNAASDKQPPRGWRLSITIERENGQPKMSKVEFVP